MRTRASTNGVTVQAIAGNNAIFFGFDLSDQARKDCLGFAIHREDQTENEAYWLAGFKTFRSVVPNPDPKIIYSTRDHPIQSFYWGDYSAKPGHQYRYRIVPRYGKPKKLENHPGAEITLGVSTNDPSQGTHGIYFNRGVAASQAYATKYGKSPKSLEDDKRADAMRWLSRGLVEAIVAFVGQASSGQHALRAAVYEFTEPSVLKAFKDAHQAGADVKIVYHARSGSEGERNRAAIKKAGLPNSILIQRTKSKIAHNKFIVFGRATANDGIDPASVWTGSTNLSQGGIFGHSNVGHAIRDPQVAARYQEYWEELATDPDAADLRVWAASKSPFNPSALTPAGLHTLFSPRTGLAVLNWYANRFGRAAVVANITQAFGVGAVFEEELIKYSGNAIHYVMLDKKDDNQDVWARDSKIMVAVGASGGPDELSRWAKEKLTGFNPRVPYVHTKILLIDPLSADPTVITGSANFSPASTNTNDENMVIIRGDREVADVYFTEYARMFIHFYARWWAKQLTEGTEDAETHGFLKEGPEWQDPYFKPGNPKQIQRDLFSSGVQGNV